MYIFNTITNCRLIILHVVTCLLLLSIASFASASGPAASSMISFRSLIEEMIDRDALARFPDPAYTCRQFSSYDRKSVSPEEEWFANADANQYLREEVNDGRTEFVMMDTEGPGAVVRIWSANPPSDGTLRIYLDGKEEPAIAAPMKDMLGGTWKVPPPLSSERSRGWNLYMPIPYARHCKITCDKRGFYYQINYRTYEDGARVATFQPELFERDLVLLNEMQQTLLDPENYFATTQAAEYAKKHEQTSTLSPGRAFELTLPVGSNAVRSLTIRIKADNMPNALRQTVLEGSFDGEQTIWCPVGDFIGSGIGINDFADWYRQPLKTSDGAVSYWVMPYKSNGRFRISNLGSDPVEVTIEASTTSWQWDDRSMHFHTRWRQENPIRTRPMKDWNYISIKGKGVFVGDTLAVANPVKAWWGEGDEKIYTDGETFPSHFGTGTEDYYGYAWCCPEPFKAPFHSQARCDGPNNYGHTTVSRVRSLDGIPFESDFRFDMEVWHWKDCEVGYAATTHFYAMPGATHNRPALPEEASRGALDPEPLPQPFKIKGGIEADSLRIVNRTEGYSVGAQSGFGEGLWSGDKQLWSQSKKIGDFIELEIPATDNNEKHIFVHATKSWDYAIVRFSINGKRAGEDTDLYNTMERKVIATGPIDLGVHTPKDGKFILRIEVVGSNERSEGTGTFFGIDCIVLKDD